MNRFAKITAVTASAYIWLAKAKKTTKPSGKETANNVPSWAVGKSVSGHEKLPIGGHESARWRPAELPAGGHEICPLPYLFLPRL
ncbi:hypothetical protein ACQ7DA_17025 [Zafaria sp. J156]